jgi:uncharacterized protein YpuA (DUF1002 family)
MTKGEKVFEIIKTYTEFAIFIGGLLVGGTAWLTKLHYDVIKNREIRDKDKKDIMNEFANIKQRMDRVENDNTETLKLFTEIKERLASIETTITIFLNKRK